MYRLFGRTLTAVDDVDSPSTCTSHEVTRCTACGEKFSSGDLVMRAHLSVFHSTCFSCCICGRRLSRGQQFALVNAGRIYCRADYERRPAPLSDDQRRDDVTISARTDNDDSPPSSMSTVTTVCRGRRRTRKMMSSVHQDTSKTLTRSAMSANPYLQRSKCNVKPLSWRMGTRMWPALFCRKFEIACFLPRDAL